MAGTSLTITKEPFAASIKFQMGNRDSISVWHDTWIGDRPLAEKFPQLYSCARNRQAKVREYMKRTPLQTLWCPILRRNLRESEKADLFSLFFMFCIGFHP